MNDQDEMFERGTETPAFLGCTQHMPNTLPGGFDGVEPEDTVPAAPSLRGADTVGADVTAPRISTGEAAAKRSLEWCEGAAGTVEELKACNDRSRERLTEVLSIAEKVLINTVHSDGYAPGQYGKDYRKFGKALSEIRKLVKDSIGDVDPDYEMLALQFARDSFDFAKFQEAMAAVASMKQDDFPGTYYTPGWLVELAKKLEACEKPLDPTAPEIGRAVSMKPPHKGKLFKRKHISSCHGTYIYDYVCINDAHIRANLHYDNGGLEQHTTIWLGEGERCFCYATFNTCSAVKCDYIVRGMIAGLAKRLVYHHKNLIKRKAKWAAAKAAKKGGAK